MATSVSLGYCGWLAGTTWSDTIGRNMTAGLTALGTSRGGVLANVGNALQVLASSGLSATCNPGAAVIPAATVAAGPYIPVNSAVQTLTHNAADPTNPRIDRWVVQVVDNGNSTSFGQIIIVQGTAAASPSPPAVPAAGLSLAQIRINAGVSSFAQVNITDERIFTACSGGIMLCPNMANLPVGWPGLIGYDLTNSRLFALTATGAQPLHVLGAPPALAISASNKSAPSGSETTLLSVNFTADGLSDYELIGRFGDAYNSVGRDWMHLRLYVDSTMVQDNQVFAFQPAQTDGNYHYGTQNVIHVTSGLKGTTPAAGTHTVQLRVALHVNTATISGASFMPIELSVKQATL